MNLIKTFPDLIGSSGLFSDGDWIESKDQDPNGDVRLIQLADIGVGNFINKSSRFMTSAQAKNLKCTYLKPGDILIARMPDPIGRACIFPEIEMQCVTVVDICIVRVDSDIVDPHWLVHFINSNNLQRQISNWITGTTRQRISRGNLSKVEIPLPPLHEQKRIAAILDKADAIRRKRQQAIDLTDQLLRSVFLDMFGDPLINKSLWPIKNLSEITRFVTDGKHGDCNNDENSGYYFISAKDINGGKINYRKARQIVKYEFEEVHKRTNLEAGDLVMVNTGATIGKIAIAAEDERTKRTTFQKSVAIIKLDDNYVLPEFLKFVFLLRINDFASKGSGSAIKNLLLSEMRRFRIIMPPLEMQLKFQKIVSFIESDVERKKKFLLSADNVFQSLTQQAFSGERSKQAKAA